MVALMQPLALIKDASTLLTSALAAVPLWRGDSQLLHLAIQGGLVDSQRTRRGGAIEGIAFERRSDRLSFQNLMR